MSAQALPPSGTIWLACLRMPHNQHETMMSRRALRAAAEGGCISSAMTGSPPGYRRETGRPAGT
jgi:hypothetical protein